MLGYNAPNPGSPEDRIKTELSKVNARNTLAAIAKDQRGDRFAIKITEDVSSATRRAVRLKTTLSPEKAKFLKKPLFIKTHMRSIDVLRVSNLLTDAAPNYEQSLALLAELDAKQEIDLYKLMELNKKGYGMELVVSPEELTLEEIQALNAREKAVDKKINNFYCDEPSNPSFHLGKPPEAGKIRRYRVDLIAAGKDRKVPYLPSESYNPYSRHYGNGKNYNSSRITLATDKMDHPTPAAYFVLAIGKLEAREPIDLEGVTVLNMGASDENSMIPVGNTSKGVVHFCLRYALSRHDDLRVRPSGGGVYVPKKKS